VVVADKAPPPISGGTMAVTSLRRAVVADSDRDRIWVVDLASRAVSEIVLEEGDEPGRVVTGAGETAYVALRRGGALVTVDAASGKQIARTAVCPAPRGMAFDAVSDRLHVACAGGELVSLRGQEQLLRSQLRKQRV